MSLNKIDISAHTGDGDQSGEEQSEHERVTGEDVRLAG